MSISNLVEDNWWWRPDFLSFLQSLMETAKEEVKLPLDEMERRLRVALTEEMRERDPEFGQLKKPGAVLRIEEIWMPRLLFLLRRNILSGAAEDYVLISLRGPRRVGKTTLVKLLLRELFCMVSLAQTGSVR